MTRRSVVLLVTVLFLAGCGSTIAGSPQAGTMPGSLTTAGSPATSTPSEPAPSTEPSGVSTASTSETSAEITPTSDPPGSGPFPTELPEVDEEIGRWLEARRLGDRLPNPAQIDDLYAFRREPTAAFTSSAALEEIMLDGSTDIIDDIGGLVAGFMTTRSDETEYDYLTLLVLEFETEAQATAAAETMLQPERAIDLVTVPGFGDLEALLWEYPDEAGRGVEAAVARDRLVLYAWVDGPEKRDYLPTLSAALKALEDAFADMVLTPPDELTSLPLDNGGLLAHTVDVDVSGEQGWHEPHGALHLQNDALHSADLFERAGVDLVSANTVVIYRAADEAGALLLRDELMEASGDFSELEIDSMPDGVRCSVDGEAHLCIGIVGRYAYEFIENGEDSSVEIATEQAALLGLL